MYNQSHLCKLKLSNPDDLKVLISFPETLLVITFLPIIVKLFNPYIALTRTLCFLILKFTTATFFIIL